MPKILVIYPSDTSTDFLQAIVTNLTKHIQIQVEKPDATIISHKNCIEKIRTTDAKLILYMGHGQSDKLLGANSSDSDAEYQVYREKGFINKDNIAIFADKSVISLSCNSNEKMGKMAIVAGAKVFVGFGYIPTDWIVEAEEVSHLEPDDVEKFNTLLVKVVSNAISYAIHNHFTFQQFEKVFKIIVNKQIVETVASGVAHNSWLVQSLYNLKDEIKIFGNSAIDFS